MDTGKETVIILDEEAVAPVTLSGEVAMLCAAGERDAAMIALARAIERLAADSHAPKPIAPQVEAVLRAWGYVSLVDLPPGELPDDLILPARAP